MRKDAGFGSYAPNSISTTLTVYFDGHFWVGIAERIDSERLEACRIVFGAEPSNEDIYQFVLRQWDQLHFCAPIDAAPSSEKRPANPKRRQREAAKEAARARPSTRAQQALALERDARKLEGRNLSSAMAKELARTRYEQKREKRRKKHRGH